MTIPCSVYIITLNCAPWLQQTLESLMDFAEVIILDSGSTDGTQAIVNAFPNVRLHHQEWLGYAGQKEKALLMCKEKWVLNIDGDEVLTEELKNEISQTIHEDKVDALITPILDIFLGLPNHPWIKKQAKVRFFRRGKGSYDLNNKVHEGILIQSTNIKRAHGGILHFGESSVAIKVSKNNEYSTLKAIEKHSKNRQPSLIKLILSMPLFFIKSYVLQRNFLNGKRGFIASMINAFYAFLKEAKLYESYWKDR